MAGILKLYNSTIIGYHAKDAKLHPNESNGSKNGNVMRDKDIMH